MYVQRAPLKVAVAGQWCRLLGQIVGSLRHLCEEKRKEARHQMVYKAAVFFGVSLIPLLWPLIPFTAFTALAASERRRHETRGGTWEGCNKAQYQPKKKVT